jgi:hypothetical protein
MCALYTAAHITLRVNITPRVQQRTRASVHSYSSAYAAVYVSARVQQQYMCPRLRAHHSPASGGGSSKDAYKAALLYISLAPSAAAGLRRVHANTASLVYGRKQSIVGHITYVCSNVCSNTQEA